MLKLFGICKYVETSGGDQAVFRVIFRVRCCILTFTFFSGQEYHCNIRIVEEVGRSAFATRAGDCPTAQDRIRPSERYRLDP